MTTATEETRGTAELLENFAVKAIKARAVSVRFTAVASRKHGGRGSRRTEMAEAHNCSHEPAAMG